MKKKQTLLTINNIISILILILCLLYIYNKFIQNKEMMNAKIPNNINQNKLWLKNNTQWVSKTNDKYMNGIDRVYTIVLPKRINHMKQFLHKMEAKSSLLNAFPKNNIPRNNKLLFKDNYSNNNKKDNNGRMACHISHLMVLLEFLEDDNAKTALIFEDDVEIKDVSKQKLENFMNIVHESKVDWDILFPGFCWVTKSKTIKIKKGLLQIKDPRCRHAYIVNKKSAKMILDKTLPMYDNGDEMLKRLIDSGDLKAYSPETVIFNQNRETMGSNLNNNHIYKVFI